MGVSDPPNPYAKPIIRLATMDLPWGANFCAKTTPIGMVASTKNPASAAQIYAQPPLEYMKREFFPVSFELLYTYKLLIRYLINLNLKTFSDRLIYPGIKKCIV